MQVSEVRLFKTEDKGNQLAFGSITLDEVFVVSGIRVMNSEEHGKFVAFPSYKNKSGEMKDLCFPLSKELREDITTKVIAKYEEISGDFVGTGDSLEDIPFK